MAAAPTSRVKATASKPSAALRGTRPAARAAWPAGAALPGAPPAVAAPFVAPPAPAVDESSGSLPGILIEHFANIHKDSQNTELVQISQIGQSENVTTLLRCIATTDGLCAP